MGVNLQKGQKVDLTKDNAGLTKLLVGLGWDPIDQPGQRKGLLGGIFGGGSTAAFDCDASVLMINQDGKLEDISKVIYFGNLESKCGGVKHSGDNLTGDGDGDDEQIFVDLNRVASNIVRLVFVVNIYDCANRRQDFGMIRNAFIRILDPSKNQELVRYNLSENYAGRTALFTGEIYRHNGEWKFAAVGEATNDVSLQNIVKRFAY